MFKNLFLAAIVAMSFSTAIITSAIPAAAEGFDDAFDFSEGCGIGWHRRCAGCQCEPN
jgi:hypothetical protein